jgi:hypothetical protein
LNTPQEAINTLVGNRKWSKAMCTEVQSAVIKGVWEIVSRHNVPKERNIIWNRWFFAHIVDGQCCVCTVVKGYSEITDKYFQENNASVIYDTTCHKIIAMSIIYELGP